MCDEALEAAFVMSCQIIDREATKRGADGSEAVCKAYCDRFPETIRMITTENGGLGAARNVGLEMAEGEFVMFLDSDDSLSPGAIKEILAELCRTKGGRVVVGFAAETDDLIAYAQAKLARKGADLIVANDVSNPASTFGSDTNLVSLVTAGGVEELPLMSKAAVADALLDRVASLVAGRG